MEQDSQPMTDIVVDKVLSNSDQKARASLNLPEDSHLGNFPSKRWEQHLQNRPRANSDPCSLHGQSIFNTTRTTVQNKIQIIYKMIGTYSTFKSNNPIYWCED